MGDILMSEKEIYRYEILEKVKKRELELSKAAIFLGLGYRQTKRIWASYKKEGKKGLISKKRGKQSNRKMAQEKENKIIKLIHERYPDFGSTFAAEKLLEKHDIKVSKEKLRQLYIQEGLHRPRKKQQIRAYQRRTRRSQEGEMVQIDGSPHAWFEDRAPPCCLIISVDDATSKIKAARFEEQETTNGYFRLKKSYIEKHGLPLSLYSDRYGVFRVNQGKNRTKKTQFARAMEELNIELICANSPQAKGRIERTFGTLQDRLVKELRLNHISTIEEANRFLSSFLKDYNTRFGCCAAYPLDAHRILPQNINLNHILCRKETRKISKQLEVQYHNKILQIQAPERVRSLRGRQVVIMETLDGEILITFKGQLLEYKIFEEQRYQPPIVDYKKLALEWERRCKGKKRSPRHSNPWRRFRLNRQIWHKKS